MVEFVTAVGAAKGIVHCRSVKFRGEFYIDADYSPSVKPPEEQIVTGSRVNCDAYVAASTQDVDSQLETVINQVKIS